MTQSTLHKLSAIAQEAYNTRQDTGWTANPYCSKRERSLWLAHEFGIMLHNTGRSCPQYCKMIGYTCEANSKRYRATVTDSSISWERVS